MLLHFWGLRDKSNGNYLHTITKIVFFTLYPFALLPPMPLRSSFSLVSKYAITITIVSTIVYSKCSLSVQCTLASYQINCLLFKLNIFFQIPFGKIPKQHWIIICIIQCVYFCLKCIFISKIQQLCLHFVTKRLYFPPSVWCRMHFTLFCHIKMYSNVYIPLNAERVRVCVFHV